MRHSSLYDTVYKFSEFREISSIPSAAALNSGVFLGTIENGGTPNRFSPNKQVKIIGNLFLWVLVLGVSWYLGFTIYWFIKGFMEGWKRK